MTTQLTPSSPFPHSINHDVADGLSTSHFLMAWSLASTNRPFPIPSTHHRGFMLDTDVSSNGGNSGAGDSSSSKDAPTITAAEGDGAVVVVGPTLPEGMVKMGMMVQLRMVGAAITMPFHYSFFTMDFPAAELENMKAAAMEPLRGD